MNQLELEYVYSEPKWWTLHKKLLFILQPTWSSPPWRIRNTSWQGKRIPRSLHCNALGSPLKIKIYQNLRQLDWDIAITIPKWLSIFKKNHYFLQCSYWCHAPGSPVRIKTGEKLKHAIEAAILMLTFWQGCLWKSCHNRNYFLPVL